MIDENIEIISIAVISNITVEPYFSRELKRYFDSKYTLEIIFINFEDYISEVAKIKTSDIILVWIDLRILYPNFLIQNKDSSNNAANFINLVGVLYTELIEEIERVTSGKIIIMSQDENELTNIYKGSILSHLNIFRKVNNELINELSPRITILNLNRVIANIGINKSYDKINKYRWNAIYSENFINEAVFECYKQIMITKGITKKCIVLDCDNVLWGGIVAEDGIENIKLSEVGEGLYYQDFQRSILNLYYSGVILAIASKNNSDDIFDIFENHSGMILKKEHISCFKINWTNKAQNIIELSEYLNIDLDSMVFVDDSAFEIGLIKETLPEVRTILFKPYEDFYQKFDCFNIKESIDFRTIELRNSTYKTNQKRIDLQKKSINYESYLEKLNTEIEIKKSTKMDLNRITELSLRTNQCTNGLRYTIDQLLEMFDEEQYKFYSIHVQDRFGTLGLVGSIIMYSNEINLFCLSCRALGRGVEKEMMDYIVKNHNIEKIHFSDTNKERNFNLKKLIIEDYKIEMV